MAEIWLTPLPSQLRGGKNRLTDYIQKERPDSASRIHALEWKQTADDTERKVHNLVLWRGEDRTEIASTEEELLKAARGEGWRAIGDLEVF